MNHVSVPNQPAPNT